jgi:type IV conjugative transfer system coupling protein TraD
MKNNKQEQGAQVTAFTRGSQIFMHSMRMCIQGTKASCMVSAILTGSFILWRVVEKLRLVDIYYFLVERFAILKLDIGAIFYPGQEISIHFYSFASKSWVKMSALKFTTIFWQGERGKLLLSFAKWIIRDALAEISLVFSIGLLFSFGFFIYQGRKSIIRSKIRGADMVSPKELTMLLKKAKQASRMTISGLPLVKGSQRQHMLITGTTGAGKTNMLNELLPQIRKRGEKAIVVDVTGSFVQQYFDPKTDFLLNPFDERSSNWLPWADCFDTCDYDAIATAISPASSFHDSFWDASSQNIISIALQKNQKEQDLRKFLDILGKIPLEEYGGYFQDTRVASLTDPKGDKTTLSIRATICNKIKVLEHLTQTDNPFSIKNYVLNESNQGWLFISATPAQRETLAPLISTQIEIVIKGLMMKSPTQINANTWLIMDELAAFGQVPSLKTALSESRKFGGCIVAGIQNVHQLSAIYGQSQAMNLLDQFSTRFIFRVGDPQTANVSSNLLGEIETLETSQSVSFGANTMRDGVNLNTLDKKRNLVLPTEIMNLSNLTCFVKLAGNWPIAKLTMQHNKTEIKNSIFIKKELPQKSNY